MKRIFAIAGKDTGMTLRSPFSLVMMFAAPFLITGLLFFAFGNQTNGDAASGPRLSLYLLNRDAERAGNHNGSGTGTAASGGSQGAEAEHDHHGFSAGAMFMEILLSEDFSDMIQITETEEFEKGRNAVLEGEADLLLEIPENFTRQFIEGKPELILHQDPADTIIPGIGKDLIENVLREFSAISALYTTAQRTFGKHGRQLSEEASERIRSRFLKTLSEPGRTGGQTGGPEVKPAVAERHLMTVSIMYGMIVFFLFFTAANSAQTIVTEKEAGTLDRIRTTPAGPGELVGGKLIGILLTVIINAAVLTALSTILFRIRWGSSGALILHTFAVVLSASGFGIFIMSLVQNSRQTGPILGGVLTITGMMGGLFTIGVPNLPPSFDTVTKSVPQGWGLAGYRALLLGESPNRVIIPAAVLAASGAFFILLGILFLRRRFRM